MTRQMQRFLGWTILFGLAAWLSSAETGHTAGFTLKCRTGGDAAGWTVASRGDLDGDGVNDLAMSAPCAVVGRGAKARDRAGEILVVSGATGKKLIRRKGTQEGQFLGAGLAFLPDINGDGKDELIIGSPGFDVPASKNPIPDGGELANAGKIEVVNFKNRRLRRILGSQKEGGFGDTVAGIEDMDGDGRADIVVGATNERDNGTVRPGRVHVYSSANRRLIGIVAGAKGSEEFGRAISASADVDGDGAADIIVGSPSRNLSGVRNAGLVGVYPGDLADPPSLDVAGTKNDRLGKSIDDAGDRDADGIAEFIVGAYRASNTGVKQAGEVRLYTGTGSLVFSASDPEPEEQAGFGSSLANVGDITKDGLDDFAVGAPDADGITRDRDTKDAGRVVLIDGAGGSSIWALRHDLKNANFGFSTAGGFDWDDDGTPDVAVGAIGDQYLGRRGAGTVSVLSGVDGALLRLFGGRHGLSTRIYSAGRNELVGFDSEGERRRPQAAVRIRGDGSVAVLDDGGVPNPAEVLVAVAGGHGGGGSGEVVVFDAAEKDKEISSFDALEDATAPGGGSINGGVNIAAGNVGLSDDSDRLVTIQADSRRGDVQVRVFARLEEETSWFLETQFQAFIEDDGFQSSPTVSVPIEATGGTVAVGDVRSVENETDPSDEIIAGTVGGLAVVRVFDRNGNRLSEWLAYGPDENTDGGVQICVADIAGGGAAEIITVQGDGEPIIQVFTSEGVRVQVPGSNDGDLISIRPPLPDGFTGGGRACAADVDLDGRPEIVYLPGPSGPSTVQAFELDGTPVIGFEPFEVVGFGLATTDTFVRK